MGVVVQDRNGHDVVHADVDFVGFWLGGSLDDGGSRHRDNAHCAGGRRAAVRHRVAEDEWFLGSEDVRNAKDAVVDHAHGCRGAVGGDGDGLEDQHAARRIGVVGQRINQHAATHREQCDVVDCDGSSGILAGLDVHTDQPLAALGGAIAGDVGQVDRARVVLRNVNVPPSVTGGPSSAGGPRPQHEQHVGRRRWGGPHRSSTVR